MRNARFTEHYNEYYSFVCGLFYTRTGDIHISEDLTQELFIDLYRKYDSIDNVHNWLLASIRTAMLVHRRKAVRLPGQIEETEDTEILFASTDPCMETRMIISDAIDSINGFIERVVFELVSIQRYTYIDAAAALGLTKRNVRYRHGIAVRNVLQALAERGVKRVEDLL